MNKNRRNDQPRNCKKCSYSKIKHTAYYQGTKYILVKLLQLSISLLQALAAHTHLTPKRKEHVHPLCATYPQITVKSHVLFNFFFLEACGLHCVGYIDSAGCFAVDCCCDTWPDWLNHIWHAQQQEQPYRLGRKAYDWVSVSFIAERFELRSQFRWNMIARVCVVLNRTVVEITWRFDNLCSSHRQGDTTHFDSEDD